MTYVELIVVLTIFSIITSVSMFNYNKFQQKVDIKNLANDIALRIVEAQKLSTSGKIPPVSPSVSPWRPAYGLYFSMTSATSFTFFTDLDQDQLYDTALSCPSGECLNRITITKNNRVSGIQVYYNGGTSQSLSDLTLSFKRPSSLPAFRSSTAFTDTISYIEITVISPNSVSSRIKLYSSGRVQIN